MSRYTPVIELLVFLALMIASYRFGVHNAELACEAAKVKPLVQSIVTHNEKAARGLKVEKQSVAAIAHTDAVFDQLDMEVQKYAQSHPDTADCGLDANGLRLWRAANAGTDLDAAGQPDPSMPGTVTGSSQRQTGRPAGEPYRGGADLPQVPSEAIRPGQLERGDR